MGTIRKILGLVLALTALSASSAGAATLVPLGGAADPLEFDQPIFVTSAPDDPDRLLVVERPGTVREVVSGESRLYADLSGFVICCGGERGLLSIAPAPDFGVSGRFYAAYTGDEDAGGEVGDLHVDTFTPTQGAPGAVTRAPILTVTRDPARNNHNGGQLQFGPDGYLYLGTGDGGGGGDPERNGQDLESLLGKIIRIDPHPDASGGEPSYTVPPDNPFLSVPGARGEIWAYGLRNPWRFGFDRGTGDLVIGDVGEGLHEEIDWAPAPAAGRGLNFGWSKCEGPFAYPPQTEEVGGQTVFQPCSIAGATDPVFTYPHEDPEDGSVNGCSVTGGYVVRDPGLPELYGRYIFADWCKGRIYSLDLADPEGTVRNEGLNGSPNPSPNPTSFGEDSCGRIYVASGNERVLQIVGEGGPGCTLPPEAPGPGGSPKQEPPPIAARPIRRVFKLSLVADRRKARVIATVRAKPCTSAARRLSVILNKGGKPLRKGGDLRPIEKTLGRDCKAVFRLRSPGRTVLRAVGAFVRSKPLAVPAR